MTLTTNTPEILDKLIKLKDPRTEQRRNSEGFKFARYWGFMPGTITKAVINCRTLKNP